MSKHNQLYFVFCPRDGESTVMKGNSIVSIQDFKKSTSVTFPQEIKDPDTGKKSIQENTIPGVNYNTEVLEINGFTNTAVIRITRKTKNGDVVSVFKVNCNECVTYIDDKYIIKFGVAELENEKYAPKEEVNNITRQNVAKIGKLTGLDLNVLSSDKEPSSIANNDEPAK